MIQDKIKWKGRERIISWESALPPPELITQVSGICFTNDGLIVLIAEDDGVWKLPGGKPDPYETLEQTFIRETWEEACAIVEECVFIGAQRIDDPNHPQGLTPRYQVRFWARVRLEPFDPQFETLYRVEIKPELMIPTLNWDAKRVLQAIIESAVEEEARHSPMN